MTLLKSIFNCEILTLNIIEFAEPGAQGLKQQRKSRRCEIAEARYLCGLLSKRRQWRKRGRRRPNAEEA